jgi:hypothetical protein
MDYARSKEDADRLAQQVNRVEQRAVLLLRAVVSIYVALGGLVSATLITLKGAGMAQLGGSRWFHLLAALGLVMGLVDLGSLAFGGVHLFRSTQVSPVSLQQETALISMVQRPSGFGH